ncbi:MAG: DUF2752 domain-containing protein [Planctomycetota bacterium]
MKRFLHADRPPWLVHPAGKLILLAAPLLLGLCIEGTGERATLCGVEGPPCLVGEALGERACPGCGLTRSTTLALHGDFRQAFAVHPGGLLVVVLCLAGILVRADALRRGGDSPGHEMLIGLGRRAFLIGMLAAWLGRWIF